MLGILCLLSCLGAVFCGGIGLTEPLLQYPLGARTSIAYGNNAFLARYAGLGTVAGAAVAAPLTAGFGHAAVATPFAAVQEGIYAGPVATNAAIAAQVGAVGTVASPLAAVGGSLVAARTGIATPVAAIAATPFAGEFAHAAVAAPVAAVGSPLLAARTAVAAPLIASAPVVSSVEHVPAVAQVPVTKYEAQPALIQNVVDVANPKVATRKFEIRRPAIEKKFYDIEERVVVRPAGSAVVELDQPISKNQRGPTVVSPAAEPVESLVAGAPLRALPVGHALHAQTIFPAISAVPVHSYPLQGPTLQQPVIPSLGVTPIPSQPIGPSTPRPGLGDQPQFDDSESVSVENPELGRARIATQQERQDVDELRTLQIGRLLEQSRAQAGARAQQEYQAQARAQQEYQAQARAQAEARAQQEYQAQARLQAEARAQQEFQAQARAQAESRAQQEFQARARFQAQQQLIEQQQVIEKQQLQARLRSQQALERQSIVPAPVRENVEVKTRVGGIRLGGISGGFARASLEGEEVPSVRNLPEVELSNQARLIALLTERGPVSELRSADGLDGRVRARVLSATPAPLNVDPQDEKVSTRRVVVNRPIQTVQEVDVVEPFTKIERVAVQQPALIKTARLGVANVPTAVPVHTYTHAHYAI